MPKYIKPIEPPRVVQPSDDPTGEGELRFDASELFLHDLFAQEPVNAHGTDAELFLRDKDKSTIDPLYGEPAETVWDGPYKMRVHIEWPEFTPEVSEEGMRSLGPSGCWIPRLTIEESQARPPKAGDIIRFWRLPYFDERDGKAKPGVIQGFFFDIIKVNDDGHLHDDAAFVGFRCDLKRRSNAPPELNFHKAKADTDEC